MKRALLTAVVVLSVIGLVASASAGQKHPYRDPNNSNDGNLQKYAQNPSSNLQSKLNFVQKFNQPQAQNSQNIRPSWKANGDTFGTSDGNASPKKHGKKHQQQMQLDPGRPDGRVQVADVAPPVATLPPSYARPGYVFVNGHWERAKANGTSVSTPGGPLNATVEIRDHQSVVTTTSAGSSGRGSNVPYGSYDGHKPPPVGNNSSVQVTDSQGRPRDNTIYGTGPGLYDFLKIHDPRLLWEYRPGAGFTAPQHPSRDHRTPNDKNAR